jgi:hypothetical protein
VEKLAVNAVMAGCSPLFMPVLEAGVDCLADPDANAIQSSVSTGSWAYFYLLNGPIRETLDVNCDTGAFGPGFRANATIGRALGLAYKNAALIHPGEKDMGVMGNPFKYHLVAGENEERSPWEPYHVEQGFDAGTSTITLSAPNSFLQHIPAEMSPQGVLTDLIDNTPPQVVGVETEAARYEVFHAICPYNAAELADFTKAEIREYVAGNAFLPRGANAADNLDPDAEGPALAPLARPQFEDPDMINLAVVGGSGRFDAMLGPTIGGPVTTEISLPDGWPTLVERYGHTLDREW